MRIIGGKHKRRKLSSVPGLDTRPTTDRVRETLFNILSDDVNGSHVLDLFAGTGAFGLEALSRGAEFAAFYEINKKAVSVIKKNIDTLRENENSVVVKADVTKKISLGKNFEGLFNLAFLDPPYGKGFIKKTLHNLIESKLLANHAVCVVEHARSEKIEELKHFEITDQRVYGKTLVTFLNYMN